MNIKQLQGLSLFLSSIKPQLRQATEQTQLIQNFKNQADRNNKKKIVDAIELDGCALRMASESLCNDREVVLASIRKKGLSLIWASRALRNDKKIVLEAIKNNSYALRLASKSLQNNIDFINEAYHLNPNIIKYVDKELIKKNKDLQKLLADFDSKKPSNKV